MQFVARRLSSALCVTLCLSLVPDLAFGFSMDGTDTPESSDAVPIVPDASSLLSFDDGAQATAEDPSAIARRKRPKKAKRPKKKRARKHSSS